MEMNFVANAYAVTASGSRRPGAATRDAHRSNARLPGYRASNAVKHLKSNSHSADKEQKLSKREREVLDLLSEGLQYKEIGERLNIEPETVRSHVKSICRKMGVRRRVEAIARYIKKAL